MALLPVVLTVLAVSPGTIAVPAFRGAGVPQETRTRVAAGLAGALAARHFTTLGPARVGELLSGAQQRALQECAPEAGLCFARFFPLLQAQSLAVGVVTVVDGRTLLEVRLRGAEDGRVLARARSSALGPDELDAAATELALALVVDFEAQRAPPEPPPPPGLGPAFWTPVIAGGVLVAAGAIELGVALRDLDAARAARGSQTEAEIELRVEDAVKRRNVGIVGMGLGAVSIAVGALVGRSTNPALSPAPVTVGAWVAPGGGGVALRGRF